jgi:hypothetical protein
MMRASHSAALGGLTLLASVAGTLSCKPGTDVSVGPKVRPVACSRLAEGRVANPCAGFRESSDLALVLRSAEQQKEGLSRVYGLEVLRRPGSEDIKAVPGQPTVYSTFPVALEVGVGQLIFTMAHAQVPLIGPGRVSYERHDGYLACDYDLQGHSAMSMDKRLVAEDGGLLVDSFVAHAHPDGRIEFAKPVFDGYSASVERIDCPPGGFSDGMVQAKLHLARSDGLMVTLDEGIPTEIVIGGVEFCAEAQLVRHPENGLCSPVNVFLMRSDLLGRLDEMPDS